MDYSKISKDISNADIIMVADKLGAVICEFTDGSGGPLVAQRLLGHWRLADGTWSKDPLTVVWFMEVDKAGEAIAGLVEFLLSQGFHSEVAEPLRAMLRRNGKMT